MDATSIFLLHLSNIPSVIFLKLSSFEGFPLKVCFHLRSVATFSLFNESNLYLAPQDAF